MCYILDLEDLAGNAFLAVKKANPDITFLSYTNIVKYGEKVLEILISGGNDAVLSLSRDQTAEFLYAYDDFFKEVRQNGKEGLQLLATNEQLENQPWGYLGTASIAAHENQEATQLLLE